VRNEIVLGPGFLDVYGIPIYSYDWSRDAGSCDKGEGRYCAGIFVRMVVRALVANPIGRTMMELSELAKKYKALQDQAMENAHKAPTVLDFQYWERKAEEYRRKIFDLAESLLPKKIGE